MQTPTLLDVEAILERLKEIYGLGSDADLARFLEMTPSGVSTWKRRGTLDLSYIVEKCLSTPTPNLKTVNLHWLIAGEGAASLETVQSIVVDEITNQTPGILQEVVSRIIEKLRAEGVVLTYVASTGNMNPGKGSRALRRSEKPL